MIEKINKDVPIQGQKGLWFSLGSGEDYPSMRYGGKHLPKKCGVYEFYIGLIHNLLCHAGACEMQSIHITFPNPSFISIKFKLWQTAENTKHQARVYVGYAVDHPNTKICLDISPEGLNATVSSDHGIWYISPVDSEEKVHFIYDQT